MNLITHEQAAIDQLRTAMLAQGIETNDRLKLDGSLERFHVEGDRVGSRNGWLCVHIDERPAGKFGCNRRFGDHQFAWKAEASTKPMTAAERKDLAERIARQRAEKDEAERKRHADAAERANAQWEAAAIATDDHPYLKRKVVKAHGLRVGPWQFTNEETGEIFTLTENALLVPLCDKSRKIHSLQGIFPAKILGKGEGARDKDFTKGGRKAGLFHVIGKPQLVDGRAVFVLAEGYATGATIHEITGHCVLVCFDAGNLLPVAEAIRANKADAIIVMAADNDQWTTTPVANPGVHFATRAAAAVGGLLAVPLFSSDDPDQPTDFNDLRCLDGVDAVRSVFETVFADRQVIQDQAVAVEAVIDDAPPAWETIEIAQPELLAGSINLDPPHERVPETIVQHSVDDDACDHGRGFHVLGHDHGSYFLYVHSKNQVLEFSSSKLASPSSLIELDDLQNWEMEHPKKGGGFNALAAANQIIKLAHRRGIYTPDRIRGRGVWIDNGRLVFHLGNRLSVDGEPTRLSNIQGSRFVYEAGGEMRAPADVALTDDEGAELVETAELYSWERQGAGILMAGWAFLAPICGALDWRPHVWISGEAGTGKSSLQKQYLLNLIDKSWALNAQGDSTEAGIRQSLGLDARPVLVDEAETGADTKSRMQGVLTLIRQSSSEGGAQTLKGTVSGRAIAYQVRSMFCLAAVAPNLTRATDIDRLTRLEMVKGDTWKTNGLSDRLAAMDADETLSQRVFARAMKLLPVVRESAKVFARVAGQHFGRQRDGDQFGTLMAGAWCMMKGYVPSDLEAMVMIKGCDWAALGAGVWVDGNDAQDALNAILSSPIKVDNRPFSVGQLLEIVTASPAATHSAGLPAYDAATHALTLHGIRVADSKEPRRLLFSMNCRELVSLVEGTDFETDLMGRLARLPGAWKSKVKKKGEQGPVEKVRFAGAPTRYVSVALNAVIGADDCDEPF
ncbi:toprim domain-containing protein [Pseudomonas tremae]|uniref:toprim domain-containing protein n=1 Tax=Pseudomonas tremae TaxID=200454 RepID=UPI001F15B517|nr:toprim domain-containing protein [Pseudomonas tremae]MCF5803354.1 bifunctional DNA primase/helicase [Pseudomonas tremae]MCF5807162.1 bifunctional DNA primase/helicase [Pseudomonas tremae]